ncbi:GNAT family N-acetyltransferase [Pseudomonas sp. 148P]|uniref:GNAT family N-acetyltransferase n=1 Tax=Pseudomonas ulcerans TaxID=3115852 RepID=A0ABU7HYJ9_9PSED|nr:MULTISPECIES: GNAT family N-acetyltransferase [unclassified Pseudomonas]MEE1925206.1 GNAT family N-acetyltransferase [Pseudomonas sp. 147P]MEE1936638.1 GNAT family N-acetyltransferase [Pseudomonas sp. 148P]
MNVRSATPDDCAAISRIARETFALACPADTPEEELQRYIDEHLTPACFHHLLGDASQALRVVEVAGQVCGFSVVDYAPERLGVALADDIAELKRCYVAAQQHGSGVAQYLMGATLEGTALPLRLTVNDQNARAIAFYQRNGFVVVGETRFQCGADIHRDLVMVRLCK